MEFKALYFDDKLLKINPHGVIGVVTLWSKPEYVMERFREAGVDLDPATSPIAVFGTLYGNGLRELLRNLLYNPQIQVLLICGHDRSGSLRDLRNFFDNGLEPFPAFFKYKSPDPKIKVAPARIIGTNRIIDDLVNREDFGQNKPEIIPFLDPSDEDTLYEIKSFFDGEEFIKKLKSKRFVETDRKNIPLPEVEVPYFPSNPRGHVVVRDAPLEAWMDLLHLITRFGRRVTLKKGERLELQNVKVVVEDPKRASREDLLNVNLDPDKLDRYFQNFLQGELRPDEAYTYGNRLRSYFKLDAVEILADRLQRDPEDRKGYFTLWDNNRDLTAKESRPCFVSVFFRKFEEKLTLTATFRTHNALDAWLLNFYGLMALQDEVLKAVNENVAEGARMLPGAITVFSHSICIDPKELDRALTVVGKRKWKMHLDPMGYFRVSLDGNEILVEHRAEDVTLKEYRGRTAVSLQHQIARDVAISDINHAMYLGRQLAKAEMALKEGREFVQD
jgi:thymidylate synthase